jgi:hypothetical protein
MAVVKSLIKQRHEAAESSRAAPTAPRKKRKRLESGELLPAV